MTSLSPATTRESAAPRPAPVPARPLDVENLRARVDTVLDDFLGEQAEILAAVGPESRELVDGVVALTRGGKRMRPAFCYWGWRGAGGAPDESIVAAAAALELFQAAALIHDDLMDDSDTRRGMPAVHRRFATLHRDLGWHGDEDRFGLAGAVLAGDMCLVWTDEMFSRSGLGPVRLAAGRRMFDRMRTELLGGQYLDVLTQSAPELPPAEAVERARHVIRYKSAKYTIEHPLLIGATLAGAGPELLRTYSEYGLALGEAFQLRDDVLGVFGDPGETGKPAGDDIREGKRTVMVGLALQKATDSQAATVRARLGDPELDAAGVAEIREILVETGALEAVETMIEDLAGQASEALETGDVAEPAREILARLIVAATSRRL